MSRGERGWRVGRWRWPVAAAAVVRALAHVPLLALGFATGWGLARGSAHRPTIAFQAYTVWHAVFFAPLVRELRAARDVDLVFVIDFQPLLPAHERAALREFAASALGFPADHIRMRWQCVWRRFDLILYADVYAHFPRRRSLNVLLYHGPGTPSRFLERSRLRKHVMDFDVILASGRHDRDLLLALRPPGRGPEIHDVGCPLLDALADPPVARAEYLRALGLDEGRKTVLYGPHWSVLGHTATLRAERLVAGVVRTLASLGLNVIIKPHRFSYTSVGSGGGDLAQVFASFVAGNVAIDPRVDDIPALAHADILVTDRSSRALNASLLGKPVIVYPVPSDTGAEPDLPDFWHRLAPIVQIAADLPDLRTRVREAAAESGITGDERRRVASGFFSHYGEATGEAVRVLTELRRRPTRSR